MPIAAVQSDTKNHRIFQKEKQIKTKKLGALCTTEHTSNADILEFRVFSLSIGGHKAHFNSFQYLRIHVVSAVD